MGEENPLVILLLLGAAVYVATLWIKDYRAAAAGNPANGALPGAVPASSTAIRIAAIGGLLLVAIETAGEYALGINDRQSTITWLFASYTLAASFVEELIFRGFIVVDKRGRLALIASIVGASLLFALLHPFVWEWREGGVQLNGGTKGWFSTALVFVASLWFYTVRFFHWNPSKSLVPCIAAHAAKNAGVIVVKYVQGFVAGWW